ncbi:hypothetical protein ACQP1O_19365 [Nocardia sp. CA-151230]|uniref:hypothetical protein n=1 Tax=Nocardia sp. CA-151230 TaxID=3239982 RepID=UPI003D93D85E
MWNGPAPLPPRQAGVCAYFPELPDDEDFSAARDAGRGWDGHWYSRDLLHAWLEVHGLR